LAAYSASSARAGAGAGVVLPRAGVADAHGDAAHPWKVEILDRDAEPLQRRRRAFRIGVRQHRDKRLAAKAEQTVGLAKVLAQQARQQRQRLVAVGMSEAVVDALE
jgi:hypothetical protein